MLDGRIEWELTPAARRAVRTAVRWQDGPELGPRALLLGLLDEAECRGAALLFAAGVDENAVLERWPNLEPREVADASEIRLSPELRVLLRQTVRHLSAEFASHELATEHLLFALLLGENEVAQWLDTRGVSPREVEAGIRARYGLTNPTAQSDVAIDLPPEESERGGASFEKVKSGPPSATSNAEVVSAADSEGSSVPQQPGELAGELRVIDAAHNRASEAVRVVEDYARFVLDDSHLTERCKQLRHRLTALANKISYFDRLTCRNTLQDVGTDLTIETERQRNLPIDVLAANFSRLRQACRTLEEFSKLIRPGLGEGFQGLRYEAYTLEKAVLTSVESLRRLDVASLYVLIDGRESVEAFDRLIDGLSAARVPLVQLRDKQLTDRELLARAQHLRDRTLGTPMRFVMNDRADLAVLSRADGVHVGQEELAVAQVRRIVGPEMLVGVSTHSIDQARAAVLEGANYIGIGPTFSSATKPFETFAGLETLRQVASEIRLPTFAIGGIDAGNIDDVLATGITRVAVSAAVAASDDPETAARELQRRLGVDV